jgi:hypothetical protein
LGKQHYTSPSTIRPTNLQEFCRLFGEITKGEDGSYPRLILLKKSYLHIFLLAGLPLPRHIFKIHKTHISNYLQDVSGGWWEIDSQKGIQRQIEFIETSQMEGDICAIPLGVEEMYAIKSGLAAWYAERCGPMYVELKQRFIGVIEMGMRQTATSD